MRPPASYVVVIDFSRLSDDDLLRSARDEPDAFGTFYERHARAVLAYLASVSGSRDVALDLTAEVFAAALEASSRYRPGEAPAKAWLMGIANNKLAAIHRRKARADAARRRLGIPRLSFTDSALERVEEMIDAEQVGYLNGMATLTPDECNAVIARVIDERAYAEVATATGTSEAALRQRVSRGLAKLAQRRKGWTP